MQDLSKFRPTITFENGRYRDDRLQTYLAYEDHWSFLIRDNDVITGFALVRKSKPDTHVIGEFFIRCEHRRKGIGAKAVDLVLKEFAGKWEIPFQTENEKGAFFWRKIILGLGYRATEIKSLSNKSLESGHEVLLAFTS
jgi:predicted acetyltransferase